MLKDLMTSRRFAPLFWCQLCSALNDNFLKNALVILILYGFAGSGPAGGAYSEMLVTATGIALIAPFFFLSGLGGEIADRFDKALVARRIRMAEIPIAALAAVGFFWHSVPVLFLALSLFGMVAALFGPVKYGILPEKLSTAELPAGSALVEGATFLAILVGTITGGIAISEARGAEFVVGVIVALAVVSWGFASLIPAKGPAAPDLKITKNPLVSTFALLAELKTDWRLWSGGHIVSWFWVVGFVALSLLPVVVKASLGGSESVVTLCLAVFTIGIATGSLLAARASHGQPNLSLVPIGALLMAVFALAIAGITGFSAPSPEPLSAAQVLQSPSGLALISSFLGLAVAGGLFVVPTFAAVQAWAPVERRARVIAGVNVLNAAYMLFGGALVAGLQAAGVSSSTLFAVTGVLNLAVIALLARAWGREVFVEAARFAAL